MSVVEALAVLLAGVAAGTINTVVGAGSLITFPTLVMLGLPPVTANVSNTIGLVPGSVSGVVGYRRELRGQAPVLARLVPVAGLGAVAGAILLLVLPDQAFAAIVPALIALAVLLVLLQPRLTDWVVQGHAQAGRQRPRVSGWAWPAVLLTGAYGGYFGAAQGVLLMAVLGLGVDESLQRLNAVKNVLGLVANSVAAVIFLVLAPVHWPAAGLIAAGSVVGGQLGAGIGRRLPERPLRVGIVLVGLVAAASFLR